jgi:hypothetical protein
MLVDCHVDAGVGRFIMGVTPIEELEERSDGQCLKALDRSVGMEFSSLQVEPLLKALSVRVTGRASQPVTLG